MMVSFCSPQKLGRRKMAPRNMRGGSAENTHISRLSQRLGELVLTLLANIRTPISVELDVSHFFEMIIFADRSFNDLKIRDRTFMSLIGESVVQKCSSFCLRPLEV